MESHRLLHLIKQSLELQHRRAHKMLDMRLTALKNSVVLRDSTPLSFNPWAISPRSAVESESESRCTSLQQLAS